MVNIFVGRQPIYTSSLDVYGYELLYRAKEMSAQVADNDLTTSSVIVNSFLEIGLKRIVGQKPAFLRLDRNYLLEKQPVPFPPDQVILQILRQSEIEPAFVEAVRLLSAKGYGLALEDFVYSKENVPLLSSASLVKIDVSHFNRQDLRRKIDEIKPYPVKVIAQNVENREMFDACLAAGFDYFQGYFLAKPNVVKGRRLPARRVMILQLLSRLYDPDVDIRELETLVRQDVSLSYKLLRMVNSAFYGMGNEVESIRHALVILGTKQLRAWLTLLALSEINDQPTSMIILAMIRARMCELLAHAMRLADEDRYFTVGLLSILDVIMELPMEEILVDLPLIGEVKQALLENTGQLGVVLKGVLAYEKGNWAEVVLPGLRMAQIREAYLEAIAWSTEISNKI